jgi:hypothetical protein
MITEFRNEWLASCSSVLAKRSCAVTGAPRTATLR